MSETIKLLVPLDFSTCSQNALLFAIQLADKIKAELLVLNVLHFQGNDLENVAFVVPELEERTEEVKAYIDEFVKNAIENIRDRLDEAPSYKGLIGLGEITTSICYEAKANQVDYYYYGYARRE